MNANGTNPRRLTYNTYDDTHPHWSGDWLQIVFASAIYSTGLADEIFIINQDGSNIRNLTNTLDIYEEVAVWRPR